MKILLSLCLALCLISCKVLVGTEIDISDLTKSDKKEINGDMYVEVASCHDFEDSRNPSDSLIEAKQIVPSILQNAKYLECFQKQFDSFARFEIPITIDRVKDGKSVSESNIELVSNESILLGIKMPENMKDRIESVERSSFGVTKLSDIEFNIRITNNKKIPYNYQAHSVFLNGNPHVATKEANTGDPINITLSDVSVAQALNGKLSPILFLVK